MSSPYSIVGYFLMFLAFNYVNLMFCRVLASASSGSPLRCRKSQTVKNRIGRWWLPSVNGLELSAPIVVSQVLKVCFSVFAFSVLDFFFLKPFLLCMPILISWWKIIPFIWPAMNWAMHCFDLEIMRSKIKVFVRCPCDVGYLYNVVDI